MQSALVGSVLAACSPGTATLDLEVRTSLVPAGEFDRVLVSVLRAGSSRTGASTAEASAEYGARLGEPFADGVRVAELDGIAPGEHVVRVQLTRPSGSVFVERWVAAHITGRTALRVRIDRDCVAVTCPGPSDPATLSECSHGTCVDPTCNPDDPSARDACPTDAVCHADAECAPTASCAIGTCQDGYCRVTAQPGACASDMFCDPDHGCTTVPQPTMDAGPTVDASTTVDAGDDAAMVVPIDAGNDAGDDAGSDAGHDAGSDAGHDAGSDAGHDANVDSGGIHGCPGEGLFCCVTSNEIGTTTCTSPTTSTCASMVPSAACVDPQVCSAGMCV